MGGVLTSEVLGVAKALGRYEINGVGNNQTNNLMVSPERFSVAMYEGPMFPNEGKGKGSLGKGVPPLVIPRFDSINTDST